MTIPRYFHLYTDGRIKELIHSQYFDIVVNQRKHENRKLVCSVHPWGFVFTKGEKSIIVDRDFLEKLLEVEV